MGNVCRRIAEDHSRASGRRLITHRRSGDYDPEIAAAVNDLELAAVIEAWDCPWRSAPELWPWLRPPRRETVTSPRISSSPRRREDEAPADSSFVTASASSPSGFVVELSPLRRGYNHPSGRLGHHRRFCSSAIVLMPGDIAASSGKSREIPVRLELQRDILAYLDAAGIEAENKDRPLFRSTVRKTKQLTANALSSKAICELVKRRLKAAKLPERLSPHSFPRDGDHRSADAGRAARGRPTKTPLRYWGIRPQARWLLFRSPRSWSWRNGAAGVVLMLKEESHAKHQ